jgi:hypothetical protein
MLADKDKQIVVLKNANNDLMDLKNQQEKDMKNQYMLVVAENKYLKDMNAKLEDRNAQLCMGIMSDMVSNDFTSMLSSFGYHANTSCEALRSKVRKDA